MHLLGLSSIPLLGLRSEAALSPLKKGVSPGTLDAKSPTTELGWDRHIRRNVPVGAFPRSRKREKITRPAERIRPEKIYHFINVCVGGCLQR